LEFKQSRSKEGAGGFLNVNTSVAKRGSAMVEKRCENDENAMMIGCGNDDLLPVANGEIAI
jgi:hypothetical protein